MTETSGETAEYWGKTRNINQNTQKYDINDQKKGDIFWEKSLKRKVEKC